MGKPVRTFFFDRQLQKGLFDVAGAEARHMAGSFRLKPGDGIVLIDGSGKRGIAEIVRASSDRVKVRILRVEEGAQAPGRVLTVATSIPKERRMEWLVEKCAELGVGAVIPTVFRRSVVRPREGRRGKEGKWRRAALEACKQSGRPTLLDVSAPRSLAEVLASEEADAKILLHPGGGASLSELARDGVGERLLVLVGPEGGLEAAEEEAAMEAGFLKAKLGPYTLRTETAAVAAAAVLLGDAELL